LYSVKYPFIDVALAPNPTVNASPMATIILISDGCNWWTGKKNHHHHIIPHLPVSLLSTFDNSLVIAAELCLWDNKVFALRMWQNFNIRNTWDIHSLWKHLYYFGNNDHSEASIKILLTRLPGHVFSHGWTLLCGQLWA